MKAPYIEITYRRGRPLAAYVYLERAPDERSVRTEPAGAGLLVDYGATGRPIGIEVTNPGEASVVPLNQVLRDLGLPVLSDSDAAPLRAA